MRFHDVQRIFVLLLILLFAKEEIITNIIQKLRILQYNVHKLKNKIIIILLNEKNAENYDILII